jgi:hypothetical protein
MKITSKEEKTYLIKHKSSSSIAQLRLGLGQDKKPKILSVEMLAGKVIPLDSVKIAINKMQEKQIQNNPPTPPNGPS